MKIRTKKSEPLPYVCHENDVVYARFHSKADAVDYTQAKLDLGNRAQFTVPLFSVGTRNPHLLNCAACKKDKR